ncbi:unnamed protein product [Pleuronectes platessa]|uniref:Uncharacterized protein n=1 Tax=Pleuronectes platessa TaxID=8262 RepID=A0A9N7VG42_PLEPL|nr:unnamed protein product [Pleuronectes platessa]
MVLSALPPASLPPSPDVLVAFGRPPRPPRPLEEALDNMDSPGQEENSPLTQFPGSPRGPLLFRVEHMESNLTGAAECRPHPLRLLSICSSACVAPLQDLPDIISRAGEGMRYSAAIRPSCD